MRQYKGYYIDHAVFNSKADIDAHIKSQLIKSIKMYSEMLFREDAISRYEKGGVMKLTEWISDREIQLHDEYGMSWEEIEELPFTA